MSAQARELVRVGAERLRAAGFEHGRHEAEWLLARLLGSSPIETYLSESPVPAEATTRFWQGIEARVAGIPLQYLLGEAEFFGRSFRVEPGVFIPRPETERIVEEALQVFRSLEARWTRPLRLLDLGTGSGCIAVTLALELPACVVVGVELSWEALLVAQANILRHRCADRVRLIQGRWLDAIAGACDGIVSNPPYVPSALVDHLPLDVRQEPRLSLDGGPDGSRNLVELIREAPRILQPGGCLVLECGEEHVEALRRRLALAPWVASVEPFTDLAARPRGLLAIRREAN